MAGDDGAAVVGGERIAESGEFGADCDDRREGIFAAGVVVGAGFSRSANSDGLISHKPS